MYHQLLIAHSYLRWIVLASLLFQLGWFYFQMKKKAILSTPQYRLLLLLTLIIDIQFLLGWWLYFESPLVTAFWNDVQQGVNTRSLRFFGIEHMTMMSLGVLLINWSVAGAKNKIGSPYFSFLWKRYLLIALIILSSVPWSFSPFTSRPNWR